MKLKTKRSLGSERGIRGGRKRESGGKERKRKGKRRRSERALRRGSSSSSSWLQISRSPSPAHRAEDRFHHANFLQNTVSSMMCSTAESLPMTAMSLILDQSCRAHDSNLHFFCERAMCFKHSIPRRLMAFFLFFGTAAACVVRLGNLRSTRVQLDSAA